MTEIQDLLDHASDVPVTVDVASDVSRGRAAVRRRRRLAGGGAAGAAVVVVAVASVGLAGIGHDDRATDSAPYAATSTAPSVAPSGATTDPPAPEPTVIPGQPVRPDLGQFFDVPPAPHGWFYYGQDQFTAIYAPDGARPVMGDFEDRLVVLLSRPDSGPGRTAQPVDRDGRTFYTRDGDSGYRSVWVEQDSGEWLAVQYPRSAGFSFPDMLDFLDAVEVQPLAESAG